MPDSDEKVWVALELNVSAYNVRVQMTRAEFDRLRADLEENGGPIDFDDAGLDYTDIINDLEVEIENAEIVKPRTEPTP